MYFKISNPNPNAQINHMKISDPLLFLFVLFLETILTFFSCDNEYIGKKAKPLRPDP